MAISNKEDRLNGNLIVNCREQRGQKNGERGNGFNLKEYTRLT